MVLAVSIMCSSSKTTVHCRIGRLARQAFSDHGQMIDNLSGSLKSLKQDLDAGVGLHTTFVSSRIFESVEKLSTCKLSCGCSIFLT